MMNPDPFAQPPVDPAERARAHRELGVSAIAVKGWSLIGPDGEPVMQGVGGVVRIGSDARFYEAERAARRRTSERN